MCVQVEKSSGYDIIKQTFTEREKCSLSEIEAFKPPLVAVPMKKHSGYRELFASRFYLLLLLYTILNSYIHSKNNPTS